MWTKYSKMETLKDKFSTWNTECKEWVAIEKIHGCNMSILVEGPDKFTYFRRNGIIEEDEDFYGYRETFSKYEDSLKKIFCELEQPYTVYGEYFGGEYPGYKTFCKQVQKEIKYCDKNDFIPFDIKIDKEFLSIKDLEIVLSGTDFKWLPPLCKGSLLDVMKFDTENVDTQIPKFYGLPQLEGNYIEGVVIRPVTNLYHRCDRVMFKKKSKRFTERSIIVPTKPEDPLITDFVNKLSSFITPQRFVNVVSKEKEELTDKDIGRLIKLLIEDAYEDFKIEYPGDQCVKLVKKGRKMVTPMALRIVRDHL